MVYHMTMWRVLESSEARKCLRRVPREIARRYVIWVDVVRLGGCSALRDVPGFSDEALEGEWKGYRSSRLNRQWRVIYRQDNEDVTVIVVRRK